MIQSLQHLIATLRAHEYSTDALEMERLSNQLDSSDASTVASAAETIRGRCHAKDLGDILIRTMPLGADERETYPGFAWDRLLDRLAHDMANLIEEHRTTQPKNHEVA